MEEEKKKIRTAVYCRVSTMSDLQDGSFEVQMEHLKRRVEQAPELILAGEYGDRGKSGRSLRERPEFLKMLQDCKAGRIDLILTKSISRFSRNLLEALSEDCADSMASSCS